MKEREIIKKKFASKLDFGIFLLSISCICIFTTFVSDISRPSSRMVGYISESFIGILYSSFQNSSWRRSYKSFWLIPGQPSVVISLGVCSWPSFLNACVCVCMYVCMCVCLCVYVCVCVCARERDGGGGVNGAMVVIEENGSSKLRSSSWQCYFLLYNEQWWETCFLCSLANKNRQDLFSFSFCFFPFLTKVCSICSTQVSL